MKTGNWEFSMARFEKDIGALWIKESRQGTKFMSGNIRIGEDTIEVVVFKNKFKKEGSREPDFRIYESEPMEEKPTMREAPMDAQADDWPPAPPPDDSPPFK